MSTQINKEPLQTLIPEETRAWLEQRANENGRTLESEILALLEESRLAEPAKKKH